MWRPDRSVVGPERARVRDIEPLNRVFSDAFTDRYRRDGLTAVRVPFLNPAIWQFAITDAGEGAMLWRDARGDIIAFNIVHRSGGEGWMGPLAVRIDRQGSGLGRQIVQAGIAWLESQGATTIGLETMPRTIDNIGFYCALGFVPSPLTITLQRDAPRRAALPAGRLGALAPAELRHAVDQCRRLSDRVSPGVDFSRELELTLELRLGDATVLHDADGALRGFALWHTAPLAKGRSVEELRVLKLVAPDTATALALIAAMEHEAAVQGLAHLSLRCQTCYGELFSALVIDGFRVQWTDLRLTLAGKPEHKSHGILLSNWEI
jgi:GNAT superfamily N-acetyltransferase